MKALRLPALLLALAAAGAAHAQLFPDNEARKAIVDLRAATEQQHKAQAELNKDLAEQVATLRRSLLELNSQLEALRGELARQRGANEQLARDVSELQRRQKDIAQGVEDRMRKLEPQKVTFDGREFIADADEKRQYEEAFGLLRGGDFGAATVALSGFLSRWPHSGYGDSARFWLGNALYGKRDLKESIAAFRNFIASAPPEHPRVPEALLALANAQSESKDTRSARATLNDLLKRYPQSEAAQAGKERLAALK
ncbi:MAG TPA: tol-pal system protein YbgF [Burkholderiaceae bacterium]|nr:tol-pal system protein YbgF [Burkholderiaceae bacterium]